jgi:hypothetical protein
MVQLNDVIFYVCFENYKKVGSIASTCNSYVSLRSEISNPGQTGKKDTAEITLGGSFKYPCVFINRADASVSVVNPHRLYQLKRRFFNPLSLFYLLHEFWFPSFKTLIKLIMFFIIFF